jgi:hypothetical protein
MSQQPPDPTRWLADLMQAEHAVLWPAGDAFGTSKALAAAATSWTKAVAAFTAWQLNTLQQMAAPWTAAMPGVAFAATPAKDKRFAGEEWSKDPRFDALARTYLAQTEQVRKALEAAPLDERSKAQWGFALSQLTDALSPANMLVTNPEALQLAVETGGASLAEGLRLFTEDLARGRIAMTDETAFEVGRNICTTPGSVIYQNDLMQRITRADKVNTLGFCVGGTLLASALAVQAARGEHPAASMTLLTTMLDFTDTGEIGRLVSEPGVAAREAAIGQGGLLKGSELAQVFASLRANDLIWPYVVKGYLQGKAPPAFDLLYWNSDDTNLPGPMFC